MSVDEAIERIIEDGTGRWTLLCAVVLALSSGVAALQINVLTYVSDCAVAEWGLPLLNKGSVMAASWAGQIVGNIVFMPLADIIGRWWVFVISTFGAFFFGVLSTIMPNFPMLLFACLMVGFFEGPWMVAVDLLAEYVPISRRGMLLNLSSIGWGVGAFTICAAAGMVIPSSSWRVLLLVASLPTGVALVLVPQLTESPRWLLAQGRPEDALRSLKYIAWVNGCEVPCGALADPEARPTPRTAVRGDAPQSYVDRARRILERCATLFAPARVRQTLAVYGIFAGQSFAYQIIVLTKGAQGRPMKTGHFDYGFMTFSALAEVLFPLLVIPTVDRPDLGWLGGRRGMQTLPYSVAAVAMLLVVRSQMTAAVTLLTFTARGLMSAASGITIIHTAEVFDTEIRSTGTGTANVVGMLSGIAASYMATGSLDHNGDLVAMACACAACAALPYALPETASTSLDGGSLGEGQKLCAA